MNEVRYFTCHLIQMKLVFEELIPDVFVSGLCFVIKQAQQATIICSVMLVLQKTFSKLSLH